MLTLLPDVSCQVSTTCTLEQEVQVVLVFEGAMQGFDIGAGRASHTQHIALGKHVSLLGCRLQRGSRHSLER